jgi:HSP20 family protein
MAEKHTEMARREERRPARLEGADPFQMLERFAEEMDRVFDDFGFGRSWLTPRFGRGWLRPLRTGRAEAWMPDIEMFSRDNELVIRADLPGLTKDDVKVDVTEDRLTIQGERKREHEEEKRGVYRCERSYGSFYREIPLPEGAITEQAKASFKDGVLEVTMPAPPEHVRRGRRLEITETTKK